jgi:hypothetical protein
MVHRRCGAYILGQKKGLGDLFVTKFEDRILSGNGKCLVKLCLEVTEIICSAIAVSSSQVKVCFRVGMVVLLIWESRRVGGDLK